MLWLVRSRGNSSCSSEYWSCSPRLTYALFAFAALLLPFSVAWFAIGALFDVEAGGIGTWLPFFTTCCWTSKGCCPMLRELKGGSCLSRPALSCPVCAVANCWPLMIGLPNLVSSLTTFGGMLLMFAPPFYVFCLSYDELSIGGS